MRSYCKLYEYIYYFEDRNKEFCSRISGMKNENKIFLGYPVYSKEFDNFINEVYRTDLLKYDYLPYLESLEESNLLVKIIETEEINDYIDKADFETIKALLTYYVRQHRFDEDIWEIAAKKGAFHRLLTRIKDIVEGT